jgi:farnesyl diphosphate synthase
MREARREEGTVRGPEAGIATWLEESRLWAERQLQRHMPPADAPPALLHEAMRYALFGGGKRLRPALVRMVCERVGGDEAAASRPAAALEMVHTYSLIHDDLPCMDDDELRRGRPTCHIAFDEATAVLAGDGLLTLAFEVVAGKGDRCAAEMVGVLARTAGASGMVGGQILDLTLERGESGEGDDLSRVTDMHARKTAALFAAAGELGAIAGGGGAEERRRAREYGEALGLCFQATDDLLDVTGDAASLGKTPGKDAALARTTLVAVLGFEGARREASRLAEEAGIRARSLGFAEGHPGFELAGHVLARRK